MVRTYAHNPSTQSTKTFDKNTYENTQPAEDASLHSSTSCDNSVSSLNFGNQLASVSTELFGFHRVVVNGQLLYQPIDPKLNQLINREFINMGFIKGTSKFNNITNDSPTKRDVNIMAMQIAARNSEPTQNTDQNIFNASHPFEMNTMNALNATSIAAAQLPLQQKKFVSDLPDKNAHDTMYSDLPWARGNPQPKSGKRGSLHWSNGQRIPKAPTLLYEDNNLFTTYNSETPMPVQLPSLNFADPDISGSFFNSFYTTNNNNSGSFIFEKTKRNAILNDNEQHKLDLLQQIEDNRRRREFEKIKERQLEERERLRSEIFQARQQAEIDAERRMTREKALAAEKRQIHAAENSVFKSKSNHSNTTSFNHNNSNNTERPLSNDDMSGPPRKQEWWEKKTWNSDQRGHSPVIPTLRNKGN